MFAITLTSSCTDWLKERVDFQVSDWEQKILEGTHGAGREYVNWSEKSCMNRASLCACSTRF